MQNMPSIDYMGYAVILDSRPAPEGRFYSMFWIHRHTPRFHGIQMPAVYHEGPEAGITYDTAEIAHQAAADRARAWIDANPVK